MNGYDALLQSAAWIDISSRGKLRAVGEDRQRLLHAIASNAVERLSPGQGTFAFFLNAQGKIQSDSRIFVDQNEVWIDCEPEARSTLRTHIDNYIIMDDVTLTDESESVAAVALEGPKTDEVARGIFREALPDTAQYAHRLVDDIRILRASSSGQPGLWFFGPSAKIRELSGRFTATGVVTALEQDFRAVRVENRRPRFGEDYSSANIPHETQLLQAVSFNKGCYLGQEIVERVRARGQVNKLLSVIELDTQEPPPAGSVVRLGDREVGQISSPIWSPRAGKTLAFAILRREAVEPGSRISIRGETDETIPVRVLGPPDPS